LGSRPLGLALRHLGLVLGLRSLAGLNSRPSPHRLDLRHDVRARISSPDRLPLWLECVSRFTLAVICLSKAPAVTAQCVTANARVSTRSCGSAFIPQPGCGIADAPGSPA
jgi:hypothetical protein